MKEVLLTLLSLTLSGSLLCVLVLLLRPVMGNRVPRAVSYYLWLAVLLRFLRYPLPLREQSHCLL